MPLLLVDINALKLERPHCNIETWKWDVGSCRVSIIIKKLGFKKFEKTHINEYRFQNSYYRFCIIIQIYVSIRIYHSLMDNFLNPSDFGLSKIDNNLRVEVWAESRIWCSIYGKNYLFLANLATRILICKIDKFGKSSTFYNYLISEIFS